MRGIILFESIRLFGLYDGLKFWFRWSFNDPIKMLYWRIINKPYCTYCGYYCREDCNAKKLYTREEIKEQLNKKSCRAILNMEDGHFVICEYWEGHNGNHGGLFFEWESLNGYADREYYFRGLNLFKMYIKRRFKK